MIGPLPRVNYKDDRNKMKIPTSSMYNSTSLPKSSVVNVSSNDVTNNLKKKGPKKKMTQNLPIIFKLGVRFFDTSTCEAKLG